MSSKWTGCLDENFHVPVFLISDLGDFPIVYKEMMHQVPYLEHS